MPSPSTPLALSSSSDDLVVTVEVDIAPEHIKEGCAFIRVGLWRRQTELRIQTLWGRTMGTWSTRLGCLLPEQRKMIPNNSVFLRSGHAWCCLILLQTLESEVFLCPLTNKEMEMLTRKQKLYPVDNLVRVFYYRQIRLSIGSTTYWLLDHVVLLSLPAVKCDQCLGDTG